MLTRPSQPFHRLGPPNRPAILRRCKDLLGAGVKWLH
jgi:hypothetical protein